MPIDIRGLTPLLGVFDMQRSVRFYRDVLGFEIVSTSAPGDDFGWALLRRGGAELMLNIIHGDGEGSSAPDPARIAAHRDAALFFGCPDLDAAYAHLRAHGVDAEEPFVQGYGMKQLYLRDPDGYTLCLQWPASPETADQWREWYGLEAGEGEGSGSVDRTVGSISSFIIAGASPGTTTATWVPRACAPALSRCCPARAPSRTRR